MQKLWETLRADVYRYRASTSLRAFLSAWWSEPGFRFTWYLRKVAHYHPRRKSIHAVAYLYNRILLNHYRFRYGFDISPQTAIGPGFYLGHFGGVVISPFAVIGANVNVNQRATIGATSRGPNRGAPVLEDRVWIGAGSFVVGKVRVGHDSLIAPGSYVNFDVEPHSLVLGNPGKCVSQRGSAGYINNQAPGTPGNAGASSSEEMQATASTLL